MIFEQEHIAFEFFDALFIEQARTKSYNSERNFDALSFRIEADTLIESNKKKILLSDNSVCYFPANANYRRTSEKDKMIVVHFKAFNYRSDEIEKFVPNDSEKYRRLFEKILECRMKKELAYKNECSSLLYKIFAEFYRDCAGERKKTPISEAVDYINKNYANVDFSLERAAAKAFMSESYFRKLFKKEFGIPPKQYVVKKRIDRAKALILTGYYGIGEVSELCGYNDSKYFSVEFKKYTGITPSRFSYNFR